MARYTAADLAPEEQQTNAAQELDTKSRIKAFAAKVAELGKEALSPTALANKTWALAHATAETLSPPTTATELRARLDPNVGMSGVTEMLQNTGEDVKRAATAITPVAEYVPGLTPQDWQQNLGAEAALGAAGMMPGVRAAGRTVGRALEGLSGLKYRAPGRLGEVFETPGKIFAPGRESAEEGFEQAVKSLPDENSVLDSIPERAARLKRADEAIRGGEKLSGRDAYRARRAADKETFSKSGTSLDEEWLRKLRDTADDIVKKNPEMVAADSAYTAAARADAGRNILPMNRRGDVSYGNLLVTALKHGVVPELASSPLVQSLTAALLGGVRRVAPAAASAALPDKKVSTQDSSLLERILAARRTK